MTKKTYTLKNLERTSIDALLVELNTLALGEKNLNLKLEFKLYEETLSSIDFLKKLLKKNAQLGSDFILKIPQNISQLFFSYSVVSKEFLPVLLLCSTQTQTTLLNTDKDYRNWGSDWSALRDMLLKNENNAFLLLKSFPTQKLNELEENLEEYKSSLYINRETFKNNKNKKDTAVNNFKLRSALAQTQAAIWYLKSKRECFEALLWGKELTQAQQYYNQNKEDLINNYHYAELAFHFRELGEKKLSQFLFQNIDNIVSSIPRSPTSHTYPVSRQLLDIFKDPKLTQELFEDLTPKQQKDIVSECNEWFIKDIVSGFHEWQHKDVSYLTKIGFGAVNDLAPDTKKELYSDLSYSILRAYSYERQNKEKISLQKKLHNYQELGFSIPYLLDKSNLLIHLIAQKSASLEDIMYCVEQYPQVLTKTQAIKYENSYALKSDDFLLFSPLATAVLTSRFDVADKFLTFPECESHLLLKLNTAEQKLSHGVSFFYNVRDIDYHQAAYLVDKKLIDFSQVEEKELCQLIFQTLLYRDLDPERQSNNPIIDCFVPLFEKILPNLSVKQKKELEHYVAQLNKETKNSELSRSYGRLTYRHGEVALDKIKLLLAAPEAFLTHQGPKKTVRKV